MRRIRLRRDDGAKLTLITNDLKRSAVEIAALYKTRWQIEAMFRWIKQHLTLRKFLGRSENAVRLQILAAMIGTAHAHVRREDLAEVADFSLPAGIRNCDGIPQLRNIDSDKWFPMIRQRLVLL